MLSLFVTLFEDPGTETLGFKSKWPKRRYLKYLAMLTFVPAIYKLSNKTNAIAGRRFSFCVSLVIRLTTVHLRAAHVSRQKIFGLCLMSFVSLL
jgi:hypothetical protein